MKVIQSMVKLRTALDVANAFLMQECGKSISLNELENLVAVFRHGGSGLAYIARTLNITSAAMTGAMDSLEYKGLARRGADTGDRRKFQANLTETGMKVLRIASDTM